MLKGRPVYRFGGGRAQTIIFADTGDFYEGMGKDEAFDVARAYVPGYAGTIRYDGYLTEPDQWTLQSNAVRPMHRFAFDDAAATKVYVSEITGDVVLRTTRRERFWGYLGPVPHWVTSRRCGAMARCGSKFIVWSSVLGCVMCVSGLLWGLWRLSPTSRFRLKRVPSASPYAGWMKWHHYAGLLFGAVTLTWTYSGLLSMAPFNWFTSPPTTARAARRVDGRTAASRAADARQHARGRWRQSLLHSSRRSSTRSSSRVSRSGSRTARRQPARRCNG